MARPSRTPRSFRPNPIAALALLALFAPRAGAAGASAVPLGARIAVSDCEGCLMDFPSVAGTPSGRFLAVWQSAQRLPPPHPSVRERLFASWGAPRTAELALDRRAVEQFDVQVAPTPQGNFVAVWSAVVGGESDVFAQRLSALGAPLGAVIRVSADPPRAPAAPSDFNPAVAVAADGGFAVAWMSLVPPSPAGPGSPPVLLSRRFDAAGRPLSSPVQLSDTLVSGRRASVCIDNAGRLVATWVSLDGLFPFEPSHEGVAVRRATPAGQPLGPSIVVSPPANESAAASVGCGPGSTFVVVWQGDRVIGSGRTALFARQFTRAARVFTPTLRVDTSAAQFPVNPAIAFDRGGNFIVVWEGDAPEGGQRISARRFAFSGAPYGPEFVVAPVATDIPAHPAVATTGTAGAFVVLWRDGAVGLSGQRFTP
ncbi:MAG TPA: hypothetical protein VIH93_15650 [Thermoanaerobaculia bacterium]|jgi:hypothetical protein